MTLLLKARGIQGARHGSKGEAEIWNEFRSDWSRLAYESERLLAQFSGLSVEQVTSVDISDVIVEGKEREAIVRVRVNQNFFRSAVLTAYNYRCAISGIPVIELLNACHIVPWAIDSENRVNPRNGLCLNTLLDRAFDRGLITVLPDFDVEVSSRLMKQADSDSLNATLLCYHGQKLQLPNRFLPDTEFLRYHNDQIFRG